MLLKPLDYRKLSMPEKFNSHVFMDSSRVEAINARYSEGVMEPKVLAKYNAVMGMSNTWEVRGAYDPWYIPEGYSDLQETNQEMLEKIHADLQAACKYALRYKLAGEEDDAVRCVNIIRQYASIQTFETNLGSSLNLYDGWPILIQSAMLIEGSEAIETVKDQFKTTLLNALTSMERLAYTRVNNIAAWGVCMEIAASGYLGDRRRFMRAISRWYSLFNDTIKSGYLVTNNGPAQGTLKDNVPPAEIYREGGSQGNGAYGLLYSAFHLDGLVVAAEWARINGVWVYDHVSSDGSSLKGFWEAVAYQKRWGSPRFSEDFLEVQWYNTSNLSDPSSSYYFSGYYTNRVGASFYILNQLWPNQDATELMTGFDTIDIPPGLYPTYPEGETAFHSNGYGIVQDYYGMYGADLIYDGLPLYG